MKSQDSKLEYNWKDIEEAQRTGFEECKNKILKILEEHPNINEKTSLDRAFEKIRNLK